MPDDPAPTSAEPPTASQADPSDRGYEVTTRPWVIHATIFLAFAVFFSMVALLYWRWANNHAPTSFLIVNGSAAVDGIDVRLDGERLETPAIQHLSADNEYKAKFAVQSGTYLVTFYRDGQQLAQITDVLLTDGNGRLVDISKGLGAEASTKPATQPVAPLPQ
jgi:hypothetical protein